MSILEFFGTFIGLLIVGACFIVGWYGITRGSIKTLPDGSTMKDGYIFMAWSLFWEKQKGVQEVVYMGDALRQKFTQLNRSLPRFAGKFSVERWSIRVESGYLLTPDDILAIETALTVKVDLMPGAFKIYDPKPIYRFPDWIRSPLSQCPKCMASFYGSIVWWAFVYLQSGAFSWSTHTTISYFVYWIIYCVSLSCVNMIVYKKQF